MNETTISDVLLDHLLDALARPVTFYAVDRRDVLAALRELKARREKDARIAEYMKDVEIHVTMDLEKDSDS